MCGWSDGFLCLLFGVVLSIFDGVVMLEVGLGFEDLVVVYVMVFMVVFEIIISMVGNVMLVLFIYFD